MNNLPIDTCPVNLSDEDIVEAMKEIRGYIDITTGDFKEIYGLAFQHAFKRLNQSVTAKDVMTEDVISVGKDADLIDVADTMNRHDISGVPVIGGQKIHNLGYLYAVIPVGLGALIMLLVALLINNIPKDRRYPEFWF